MQSTFRRKFNSLSFRSPRWQIVHKALFDPNRFSRYRMRHFQDLVTRFKKK